ncbi:2-hydroxymuconate tautomerase family protein [Candidatus Gracilibacteria bacterium]|nr:2-hydroxymuconate tautomerase family protein [Candidatus Gracilibacteria bacterium]
MAVHRQGVNLKSGLETVDLEVGDLIMPGRPPEGVRQIMDSGDLVNLTAPEYKPMRREKAWIAASAVLSVVVLASLNLMPIVSIIGGDDAIRLLPYLDLAVIRNNPKIFMGYSDTTIAHLACFKAGLVSFYGPAIMAGFAENGGIFPYVQESVQRTLFSTAPIGEIAPNHEGWAVEFLDWGNATLQNRRRRLEPATSWRWLQGTGTVRGRSSAAASKCSTGCAARHSGPIVCNGRVPSSFWKHLRKRRHHRRCSASCARSRQSACYRSLAQSSSGDPAATFPSSNIMLTTTGYVTLLTKSTPCHSCRLSPTWTSATPTRCSCCPTASTPNSTATPSASASSKRRSAPAFETQSAQSFFLNRRGRRGRKGYACSVPAQHAAQLRDAVLRFSALWSGFSGSQVLYQSVSKGGNGMPIVRIDMLSGRTSEQKSELIRRVTAAVVESLAVKPEQVRVLLYELPPEHWAVGGETMEERKQSGAAVIYFY